MESWIIIWKTYHEISSRNRLWRAAFWHSSIGDRALSLTCVALFIISGGFFVLAFTGKWDHPYWALIAAMTSEVVLLFRFDRLRDDWLLKEFGGATRAPESRHERGSRYLLFSKGLREAGVLEGQIKACLPLVDLQIDMSGSEGQQQKKAINFSFGVASGVAVSGLRMANSDLLLLSVVAVVLCGWIIGEAVSWFPSKVERMKELKYFLLLYGRELEGAPAGGN